MSLSSLGSSKNGNGRFSGESRSMMAPRLRDSWYRMREVLEIVKSLQHSTRETPASFGKQAANHNLQVRDLHNAVRALIQATIFRDHFK